MMLNYGFDNLHRLLLVSKDYWLVISLASFILGVLNEESSLG